MKLLIPIVIIIAAISYLPLFSYWGVIAQTDNDFTANRISEAAYLNTNYHLDKEPSVVYLEWGDAPYYIRANSTCRYASSWILTMNTAKWDITWLPEYHEEYRCLMSYQGKYIFADGNWFNVPERSRDRITEMIRRNYTLIRDNVWWVWEKKL